MGGSNHRGINVYLCRMISKYTFILLGCLFVALSGTAGTFEEGIRFVKLKHDFGRFSEDDESKVALFSFTNQSQKPMAIAQVQSSCGCAVASYTQTPIPPGKSGTIRITYNPKGRPGRFNRAIVVQVSGSDVPTKLFISGEVIPGVVRKHKAYPYVMGDLQLKTEKIRFTPMRGNEQQQRIVVINSGNTPLRLVFHSTDSSLSASLLPAVLAPNETGEIQLIRKADNSRTKARCIRLKENKTAKKEAGKLQLELVNIGCE